MDRRPFKLSLVAKLETLCELGTTTREGVRQAADSSKTTVQSWFNVFGPYETKEDDRLPDVHDLHLMLLNKFAVGLPLLTLVTAGTDACVQVSRNCGKVGTLEDGLSGAIDQVERMLSIVKDYRAAIADGVISVEESARLMAVLEQGQQGMATMGRLISAHTTIPRAPSRP